MVKLIRAAILIGLLFGAGSAFAAQNWYVLKSATGSNNGTSWTNAWTEMNQINYAAIACGDTIWLGGGNYTTTLRVNKNCTSGSVLTIYRVLSTDSVPVASPGWNSSFDSTVNINTDPGIDDPSGSYITISGRVPAGITINSPDGGANAVVGAEAGSISNVTIQYFKAIGPPCTLAGTCGGVSWGLAFSWTGNFVTNLLIDHCDVGDYVETIRELNWSNSTIQYCSLHDTGPGTPVEHIDIAYDYSFAPGGNVIWRYNTIYNSQNDGVFFEFGGATNFYFYGNVFWASDQEMIQFKQNSYGPIHIYNNVFQSTNGPCSSSCAGIQNGQPGTLTGEIYNNVFWYVGNFITGATSDYNAYNYTSLNGFSWPSGEAHSFTFNPNTQNPFVNVSKGNFQLTSNSTVLSGKGKTLAQDGFINVDMLGNVRGPAGSAWDIGAFQYSGSQSLQPQPPTGLTVAVQ